MAKKSSGSSQPVKQTSVSAESICAKPLSKRQKSAIAAIGARQKGEEAATIDYSDIPALTDKELSEFRRAPKNLVAVRLGVGNDI